MATAEIPDALVALGANLPHGGCSPEATLARALEALDGAAGMSVAAVSSLWASPAWPPGSGPDFVNAACRVETALEPTAALETLHAVEAALGRERRARWGPRACDLDLVGVGGAVAPDARTVRRWMTLPPDDQARVAPEGLLLPHPRLHERGFVLAPLAEIAPDWVHPILGRTVRAMLAALPRQDLGTLKPLGPPPPLARQAPLT